MNVTEQTFEQQVCDALHAETGWNFEPTPDHPTGAEYKDEYGTLYQLLPSAQFASYVRERLGDNSNLPNDEDEAEEAIEREVADIHTILIHSSASEVGRFGVIDLTNGRFLNA